MRAAIAAVIVLGSGTASAQVGSNPDWKKWNEPVAAFAISENIRYVGAREVSSFLISTPAGHVLMDSGFSETVPNILANLRTLNVDPKDIRYIITSHAHGDHVGGVAELKRLTGAKVLATAADADLMARGGKADPMFGDDIAYEPVLVDQRIADGYVLELGGVKLKANVTPGHTRGCTTWTTTTRIGGRDYPVVFLCSLSAPGYKLVNNPAYPDVVSDFRTSFKKVAALDCQVFLAAHGSMFDLLDKQKKLAAGDTNAFVDPKGCREFVAYARKKFEAQLARQSKPSAQVR